MRYKLMFLMTAFLLKMAVAQDKEAEVIGKPFPDIIFNNLINSPDRLVKVSDFRGKIVIVDFWATWCGPCVASLPKLQKIQKLFGDKVKILLISNEKREIVEQFFKRVKKEWAIDLPSVVEDSTAQRVFKHSFIPYTLLIDKDGMIKAIPHMEDMTEENITSLIKNQAVKIAVNEDAGKRQDIDANKPLLKDKIYGLSNTYYCMFSSYNPALGSIVYTLPNIDSLHGGKITILNTTIPGMYSVAYGSFVKRENGYPNKVPSFRIKIETRDSLKMIYPKTSAKYDWIKNNTFCLEYIFPDRNRMNAHEYLIHQVDDYFGYKSLLEKREVNCFVIKKVNNDAEKLKTKGGKYDYTDGVFLTKMINAPLDNLIYHLEHKYWAKFKTPIIDETGFTENIDLTLETDMASVEKLSASLRKKGLDIVVERRFVDFVIIKDR